jgi:hypothetical protein
LQNAGTLAIIESAIIFDLGDKVFFTGYHGTSRESGFNILESKRFIPSTGKKDWLGSGIYFYEKYSDALNWAVKSFNQDYAVLFASFPSEPSAFKLIKDYRIKRREFCARNNDIIKGVQLIELMR